MDEPQASSNIRILDDRNIDPYRIQQIREAVGWKPDSTEIWEDTIRTALSVVSAWDGDDMVGIGFMVGSLRHAVLCDLVVLPNAQRKGIGKQIGLRLVARAREKQIQYVTLTFAEDKPWLADFYATLGFYDIGNAMQLGN